MMSMRFGLIWSVCLLAAASIVVADKVTLEKPVPVTQKKADKTKINGRIVAFDEDGFEVENGVTTKRVSANNTSHTWGGLASKTYMCFRVRAYNFFGTSDWTPYACATTH